MSFNVTLNLDISTSVSKILSLPPSKSTNLLNSNLTYIDVQKLVIALNLNTKESLFSYKYVLRLLDYMYNANGNTYFSTVELLQCKGFDLTDKYLEQAKILNVEIIGTKRNDKN